MKFEDFWKQYPKRIGKGAAEKAFQKISPEDHTKIELAIDAQKRYRIEAQKTGEFVPAWANPATWLHQQRWLDEIGSHHDLKIKQERSICSIPNCQEHTHGPRFSYCYHHLSFTADGRLRSDIGLVDELRSACKDDNIHTFTRKQHIEYMKQHIGRIGK